MKGKRQVIPGRVLLTAVLPAAVPVVLMLGLFLLNRHEQAAQVAPGSGLKVAGLVAAALTSVLVAVPAMRGVADGAMRRVVVVLCLGVGLIGWPIWTLGVMPWVNGLVLEEPRLVPMRLDRLEITTISRSREVNHWAWLTPVEPGSGLAAGRYFIPQDLHDRLAAGKPTTLTVEAARGLLGAEAVLSFR